MAPARIEAHFKDCPPCVQFLDSFRQSIRLTHSYEAQEKLGALAPEVRARIEQAWQRALAATSSPGT